MSGVHEHAVLASVKNLLLWIVYLTYLAECFLKTRLLSAGIARASTLVSAFKTAGPSLRPPAHPLPGKKMLLL